MDRAQTIQKIKELAISLKDLDTPIIASIAIGAYGSSKVTSIEINNIINNIKTSTTNLTTPLHITELLDVVGKTLDRYPAHEPWEELDKLGEGTYGTVFAIQVEGEDGDEGETFAFKELKKSTISKDFVKEITSLAILNAIGSKNTPKLVGFNIQSTDALGIATELASTDLWGWSRGKSADEFSDKMPIIVDMLLESLGEIQSVGIIHGDIKPENILLWLGEGGEEGFIIKAAITDFGLASSIPNPGKLIYSGGYQAPELLNPQVHTGNGMASIQSDCWAFSQSILNICSDFNNKVKDSQVKQYFLRYLRPDQADLLTQMHDPNPKNRCIKRVTTKVPTRTYPVITDVEFTRDILQNMIVICETLKFKIDTWVIAVDILFRSETIDILTAISSVIIAQMWCDAYSWDMASLITQSGMEDLFQSEFQVDEIEGHMLELLRRINSLVWIPGLDIDKFKLMGSFRNILKYVKSVDPNDLF